MIRSTVLGGVRTKLDAFGNKQVTYVPANGLAFPLQTKDSNGNPTVSEVVRDVTGLQEDGKAVDPFGAVSQNVQPPTSGPPANMPFYGGSYGGVSWNQFTNANNFSSGCTLDGIRTNCQKLVGQVGNGNATVNAVSTTGTLADFFSAGLGGFIGAFRSGYSGSKDGKDYYLFTSAPLKGVNFPIHNTVAYFLPDGAGEWADVGWTPTNFLFADYLVGSVFGPEPQNPTPGEDIQPRNLLAHIFHLLDDNRCSTFVSNLINVARQLTGRTPYTYDGKELAAAVARQNDGGFHFDPGSGGGGGGGAASGDIFSGQGDVGIAMFNTAYGPFNREGVQVTYALTALHEIIHLAGGATSRYDGGRAYYNDFILAQAAHILTGAPGYPGGPDPTKPWWQFTAEMRAAAGSYWNTQLREHCTPQEYR